MANQDNFSTNVTDIEDPRIIASRIINEDTQELLFEIIPASFGFEEFDNVELHFYSVPANNLYLSTTIRATEDDILKSHIVSYPDDTFKVYLRIDFTRLFEKKNLSIIPGEYRITLNFFYDEIGSYDNRKLYVDIISNNRTEVQLSYFDPRDPQITLQNINELREFVLPSFPKPAAIGAAEKIFRSGVQLNDNFEGLTATNVIQNIQVPDLGQTSQNTVGRISRLSQAALPEFEQAINEFLPRLYEKLREEIVIRGDRRIQEEEFKEFINEVVDTELIYLQQTTDKRILLS